jgi:hypothetical protein
MTGESVDPHGSVGLPPDMRSSPMLGSIPKLFSQMPGSLNDWNLCRPAGRDINAKGTSGEGLVKDRNGKRAIPRPAFRQLWHALRRRLANPVALLGSRLRV